MASTRARGLEEGQARPRYVQRLMDSQERDNSVTPCTITQLQEKSERGPLGPRRYTGTTRAPLSAWDDSPNKSIITCVMFTTYYNMFDTENFSMSPPPAPFFWEGVHN